MTGVVIVEAVLLAAISFFAVGLLHSYAGLLRRVQRLERGDVAVATPTLAAASGSAPMAPAQTGPIGSSLAGETLDGEPVTLAVTGVPRNTLLAFLSSGCSTCGGFWAGLPEAADRMRAGGSRLVVVTKGAADESLSLLAALASPDVVDTVMSSAAWTDFRVPGSPYFISVDGPAATVRGEGTARRWDEVFNLMAMAEGDAQLSSERRSVVRKPASDAAREAAVDRELMGAGIMPGDPSLYPARGTER